MANIERQGDAHAPDYVHLPAWKDFNGRARRKSDYLSGKIY